MDAVLAFLAANPVPTLIVLALIVLSIVGRFGHHGAASRNDPQRMFSANQRRDGFARATDRCEMDGMLWFRCRGTAQHGDHFFPWSKGGATSMQNFVAACAHCNTSKGAKQPSRALRRRISRRRRGYFPAGLTRDAGEWFGDR